MEEWWATLDFTSVSGVVKTTLGAIISAIGLYVISLLPRLRTWLGARIFGIDNLLLDQSIMRAAELSVTAEGIRDDLTIEAAVDWMVVYVRDKDVPKIVAKMVADKDLDEVTLRNRCEAAFYTILTKRKQAGLR